MVISILGDGVDEECGEAVRPDRGMCGAFTTALYPLGIESRSPRVFDHGILLGVGSTLCMSRVYPHSG